MAIKTLVGKQEVQNLFIKEANSMASLNHKHIIQLYGIVLSQPLMLVGVVWVWSIVSSVMWSGCGHDHPYTYQYSNIV